MKNKYFASAALTVVCVLLGLLIGIQYNTVKKQAQASAVEAQRTTEVAAALKQAKDENEKLKGQLLQAEQRVKEYEASVSDKGAAMQALKSELDETRIFAGLTALTGEGITVTLNDSSQAAMQGGDTNAYLVHAEDILSIINELNVAGAEAVSINGQRIIGTSSVRCAGSVVNINGVKIAAPFVISAIGSSDILEAALVFPGGVVDTLSPWGIEIVIKKQTVEIPAYTLPRQMQIAVPADSEVE